MSLCYTYALGNVYTSFKYVGILSGTACYIIWIISFLICDHRMGLEALPLYLVFKYIYIFCLHKYRCGYFTCMMLFTCHFVCVILKVILILVVK